MDSDIEKILEIKKKSLNDKAPHEPDIMFLLADMAQSLKKISDIIETRM